MKLSKKFKKQLKKRLYAALSCIAIAITLVGLKLADFSMPFESVLNSSVAEYTNNQENRLKNTADVTYIYTLQDLVNFRDSVNAGDTYEGKTVYLMNDIDLSPECSSVRGVSWEPIANYNDEENQEIIFKGTFDGNNHTIKNIYIYTEEEKWYQGLFGYAEGDICNIKITGSITSGGYCIGAIIGDTIGNIINCHNSAYVEGCGYTGGIVGANGETSVVERCSNTGEIYSPSGNTGGILGVGWSSESVIYCYNTGYIHADEMTAGGIIGYASNTSIFNCYNTGKIYTPRNCGGITGAAGYQGVPTVYIYNCYNIGACEGYNNVGTIVGYQNANKGRSSITNCYAEDATATALNLGWYSNNSFVDDNFNINNGYPILWWQAPEIALDKKQEYIKTGEKLQLNIVQSDKVEEVLGKNYSNSDFKWTSSNEDVATVNSNGLVTGKTLGYTTITAYNQSSGLKAKAIINVYRNVDGAITVPHVEHGDTFTVVLKEDGTVWTSGANDIGQLGDGTGEDSNVPVQVKIDENTYLTNVRKISTGRDSTIALTADGYVYGWGENAWGELSQGDYEPRYYATKMKTPEGEYIQNAMDIISGNVHTMVVTKDGKVYVGGNNYFSQKLRPGGESVTEYVEDIGLSNVIKVTSGYANCGAILSNGDTLVWGHNAMGALEDKANPTPSYIIAKDVVDINLNGYFTILQKENGEVYVTGRNEVGQLGLGDNDNRYELTKVELPKDENGKTEKIKYIAGNASNALLMTQTGKIYITGYNGYGQLCTGDTENSNIFIPLVNRDGTKVMDSILLSEFGDSDKLNTQANNYSAENMGIAFIREDGTVWIAGNNDYGQIGDGTNRSTNYLTKFGVDEVVLNAQNEYIKIGETYDIDVIKTSGFNVFVQDDKMNQSDWTWESSNEDVAIIDNNGVVTGKSLGRTTITGYSSKGLKAKAIINVYRNVDGAITIPQVQYGDSFTVVLKEDGTVWASGANDVGQLGDGTGEDSNVPVQVKIDENTYLTNVRKISLGIEYAVALTVDGDVYAWGYNELGQLGQGDQENRYYATKMKLSKNEYIQNAIDIVAGEAHTMIATKPGKVYVVGHNYWYQNLTTGQEEAITYLQDVGLLNVVKVTAGCSDNGVIVSNGDALVWGHNALGALEDKPNPTLEYVISKDAVDIALIGYHTIVQKENGEIYVTGRNDLGQLGLGDNDSRYELTKVELPKDENGNTEKIKYIGGDISNTLLMTKTGKVYITGYNGYGQLCTGDTENSNIFIPLVNKDKTIVEDAILIEHLGENANYQLENRGIALIRKDGTVWIVGNNDYGQMGNGNYVSTDYLTKFGADEVVLNAQNEYIKIGDTYNIDVIKASRFNVFVQDALKQNDWTWESSNEDVASIDNNGVVTGKSLGRTTITGYSNTGLKVKAIINVYRNVNGAITVPQVQYGDISTAVLKEDGTVWTSGANDVGQLGDGTGIDSNIPVQVKIDENTYLTNVRKISVGSAFTIALTTNGEVYSWGYNEWGQLGQGDQEIRYYATRMKISESEYIQNAIDISAGATHTIIATKEGKVYVVGDNYWYQNLTTGREIVTTYLQDVRLSNVIKVSAGCANCSAIVSNGDTLVWGYNQYGALEESPNPTLQYVISKDVVDITLNGYSTVLQKENGEVYVTGRNDLGQLGLGDNDNRYELTKVELPKDENGNTEEIKYISGNASNTLLMTKTGKVYITGYNGYGQLCTGDTEDSNIFIPLVNKDKTIVDDVILLEKLGENADITEVNIGIALIREDGTIWLAGNNDYGQMGNGNNDSTDYLTIMGDGFLNYPEKNIILNVNQTKDIDEKLFSIQDDMNVFLDATSKLGNLSYEIEDEEIASIDANGIIKGLKQGITKIKVTDDNVGASTYIWVKVVEQKNVQISLGHRFTVALKQDGTVWSWGENHVGQLGTGDNVYYTEPTQITGIKEKIVDVKTGYYHSIALTEDGEIYTWGYNYYGQLGNESTQNSIIPTKVKGLKNIVKVDASKYMTIALDKNGKVYVWGNGYGSTPVKLNFSRKIIDISGDIVLAENRRAYNLDETMSYGRDLIKISAGENHYLGLTAEGEVYSWGINNYGQLGNGDNISSNVPTKVLTVDGTANITDIVEISAGDNYSIISDKDGNVYTFGDNAYNRLGQGDTRNLPEKVESLNKIELVGASEGAHTAVADWDGYVYTVGWNDCGQLGLKDSINRSEFEMVGELQIECNPSPIVMNVGDIQNVSLNLNSSFNLKSDKQNNTAIEKKILNGSIASISGNTVTGKSIGRTILNATYEGAIGVVNTDIKKYSRNIEVLVLPEGGKVVPKVESGDGYTVGLKADGTVWSWGQNQYGQLGLGNTESYNEPQKVSIVKEIVTNEDGTEKITEEIIKDIAVGNYQTLALSETGKVYAWGLGNYGQLGVGNGYNQYSPVIVSDIYGYELEDIVKVEAGENVSFAINSKGEVYVWGYGYTSRALKLEIVDNVVDVTSEYVLSGDGNVYSIETKERVALVGDIVELDEGKDHTVMLTSEGRGYSIGDNTYGQLGNGNNVTSIDTPVAIRNKDDELFTNIKEIKAGDRYTVIVTNDGKIYTVGINDNNELGIENTEISDRSTVEENVNINKVIFATAGDNHVTVIKEDGTVYAWGCGQEGQLGNRRNKDSILPVMVGNYIVRTNTNKVVLGVNSETVIEGIVDYFNVFNSNAIKLDYESKDTSVVELSDEAQNAEGKFEIKLTGKKFGTTIVTANQENSGNIGVIQVEVIPEEKEIEPTVLTNGSHIITLRVDGKVYTYGDNTYGQLGNGTTQSSDEPVEVAFPEEIKIVQIAVGENHNVALDSTGAVWTWGRNNNYQIGHTGGNQYIPYKVNGLPKVIRVTAGNNNTMVITENNELYGWGLNAYGDLGLGNYTNKVLPRKVEGIKDIIDISGGKSHYIALNRAGEIFTTGSNLYGQLGIENIEKNKVNEFTKVEIGEKIGTINAGDLSNIVTTVDGYVYVWGANMNGQLGLGDNLNRNTPTRIEDVENIRQVDMGKTHTIIRDGNNKAYVTGGNTNGQLGIATTDSINVFEENVRITNVMRVTAGNTYTGFLREDGFVWACGDYNHGDKTKKSRTNSKVPVLVGSDISSLENLEIVLMKSEIESIMANAKFKFNLIYIEENDTSDFSYTSSNTEIAEVNKEGDILGVREGTTWVKAVDGKTGKEHVAIVRVIDNTKEYETHVAPKVVAGENFGIGLKEDGTIWTWGDDKSGLADTNIPSNLNVLSTYKNITAGKNHALAIRENGTVWAVGNNEYGQLGIGVYDNKSKLVQVEGLTDVLQVAAGEKHSIAMDSYGIIYGFGANANGELGSEYIGESTNLPIVITIPGERIVQISAGKDESVFVTANGTVYGMGRILNGYVPNISDAVKAEVGDGYILILRTNGSVYRYQYGKLAKIQNIKNAIDISAQNKVNMYQSVDEKVYTWGRNTKGQLGLGNKISTSTPVQVVEHGEEVFRIGAGYNNTYIIANTGFVYGAGINTKGELGNGTNENEESTTKEESLTHTLVGDRRFTIDPETNTLEINEIEELGINSNIFNVFRNNKKDLSEYDWSVEDGTILSLLADGIIQGINLGTTNVIAIDKVTGEKQEGLRVVVPIDTDRIESITANGKEADVVAAYQYEVKVPADEGLVKANVVIKTKLETDDISIDGGATWSKGSISTTVDIEGDMAVLPFIVRTEAGNELNYTLTITKASNNNKLANITILKATDTVEIPATKVTEKVYEAIVPATGVHKIKVTAEDEKAYVSVKNLQKQLKEQTYNLVMTKEIEELPIKITSESGREENYTLIVYREDYVSTLEKVIVNGVNASKVSDTNYEVTIKENVNEPLENTEVTAITNLSTATVGINGGTKGVHTITENVGDKTVVTIEVLEPTTGKAKDYTLTINKKTTSQEEPDNPDDPDNPDIPKDVQIGKIVVNELLGNQDIEAILSKEEKDVYEVYLQNAVDKVEVIANTKDTSSQIKIAENNYVVLQDNKEIEIDSSITEVIIMVQSDFGAEKEYILRIYTLSDETGLEEVKVGTEKAIYNSVLKRYEIKVDTNLTQYDVEAKAKAETAVVELQNNISVGTVAATVLKTGAETIVPVKVKAPNGIAEETYNLAIIEKSNNVDINVVKVNGIEIKAEDDGNYIANIKSKEENLKIYAQTSDKNAKITVDNETNNRNNVTITREVTEDSTVYDIEVIAEDGYSTVTKQLTINRLSGNTEVEEVTVITPDGNTYTAIENNGVYYCKIPREDAVDITVSLVSNTSKVSIAGGESTENVVLLNEITEVNAVIEAEDGTQRTIIIKIEKESDDATLSKLIVPEATAVSKIADSKYEIQIDDRLDKIELDAITTHKKAGVKLGTESTYTEHKIQDAEIDITGIDSFTIDVIAEDGVTAKTYIVEITRKFSTALKSVVTDGEVATKNGYVYTSWLDSDDIANIVITAENPLAEISVYKNVELLKEDIGAVELQDKMTINKEIYRIIVTGPNSESSEYILYTTKKSTNNNIEFVKVNGETLTENAEIGRYEIEVEAVEEDKYELEIKAEDMYATISIDGGEYSKTNKVTESYIINPGETKEVSVKVKSQNGEEITKKVVIYRKENNIEIESVKINGIELINYDEKHKNYSIILDNTVTEADLDIILSSNKATIETSIDRTNYSSLKNLQVEDIVLPGVGRKVITFKVIAEDGTEEARTITISQFSSNIELEEVKVNGKDATKRADGNYEIIIGDKPNVASVFAKTEEADSRVIINNVGAGKLGKNTTAINNITAGTTIDVPIKVISADGTEYEYTLYITVKSADNGIEYVKVNNIDANKIDDTTYRVFVNYWATYATVDIKGLSETSIVETNSNAGNPLTFGQTLIQEITEVKFTITSEAEELKEYTLEIIKESNDNTIKNVYVNGTEIQKDEETGRYKTAINETDGNPVVKVITNNEYAYVRIGVSQEGQGEKTEKVELKDTKITTVPITVRSQTGVTNVEYLDIEVIYTASTIDTIIVDDKEVTDYNSVTKTYTALVDRKIEDHEIFIMSANTYATLEINDDIGEGNVTTFVNLEEEELEKKLKLTVTTESGYSEEYTIRLIKKSDNVNVSEVIVNDVTLHPEEGHNDIYRKTIKKLAEKAKIKVVTEYPYASIRIGDCIEEIGVSEQWVDLDLKEDVITVPVLVTATDGETIATYNIILTRVSNDTEITVNYNDNLIAQDEEGKYQVEILDTETEGKITVISTNEKTQIDIGNTGEYVEGTKEYGLEINSEDTRRTIEIPITIIAEDETKEEKTVVITRISTNARAEKVEGTIILEEAEVVKEGNLNDKGIYIINVPEVITNINVKVTAESEYATITRGITSGIGELATDVTLTDKETYVTYNILAEDGVTTESVTVKIVRQSSDNSITKIVVDGNAVEADEDGIYRVSVLGGTESAKTTVTTTNDQATIEIGNAINKALLETELKLDNEENTFTIKVTAEDGKEKEYTLVITKQTNIAGKIITENHEGKHKSLVTVYKTSDIRAEADENAPREIIAQVETKDDGTFIIDVKDIEKYDIVVTKYGYLDYRVTDIEVVKGEIITLDEYKLLAGDVVKTGEIEIDDLVAITDKYGISIKNQEGELDVNIQYDLNEDSIVNELDIEILKGNYSKKAEVIEWINPNPVIPVSLEEFTEIEGFVDSIEHIPKDFILPMKCNYTITSEYGTRIHPVTGEEKKHTGIDISGDHHTEIYSVADGEVTFAGVKAGFGNCIEIKHIVNGETIYSFYAHLSEIKVAEGQVISQGDVIALEGGDPSSDPNPGSSTGHHLHFEIRNASGYGNDVDPSDYIKF